MKATGRLPWVEILLLLFLAVLLSWGTALERRQQRLSGEIIRLHVVANSDSQSDQSEKLSVRDAVLSEASLLLKGCDSQIRAKEILLANTDKLSKAANQTLSDLGSVDTANVTLSRELFGTRTYEGFSLPGGYYDSLRVTIGTGEGNNWWCVVYPQLCTPASVSDRRAVSVLGGLDPELMNILERETPEYELKFRSMELLEDLLGWFRGGHDGIPVSR